MVAIREEVDVLVVGAGPAGSSAARAAAEMGAQVLLIEQRPRVGVPVQCAEYVPAQIVSYVDLPARCIAQRIRTLRTFLPDGTVNETPAAGYVLDRALFDKHLVVNAWRAGARVWVGARACGRTEGGVLVRKGGQVLEVQCYVLIGADGPLSSVGRWIGERVETCLDARQVEIVLARSHECTEVYFDMAFPGGYGWLFPKGETANVGVGVSRAMGGEASQALEYLLERLQIRTDAIVGRTSGLVPCGGPVSHLRVGQAVLVGDAAGHTHPVTGAGIVAAILSGTLAGRAAAQAVRMGSLEALDEYEREWAAMMAGPMRHALEKRQELERNWSDDPVALSRAIRATWIAFQSYGRRRGQGE